MAEVFRPCSNILRYVRDALDAKWLLTHFSPEGWGCFRRSGKYQCEVKLVGTKRSLTECKQALEIDPPSPTIAGAGLSLYRRALTR